MELCRICLASEKEVEFQIITDGQAEDINFTCGVYISSHIPSLICPKCTEDIKIAVQVKKIAQISDIYFKEQFEEVEKVEEVETLEECLFDDDDDATVVVEAIEDDEEIQFTIVSNHVSSEEILLQSAPQRVEEKIYNPRKSDRRINQCKCGLIFSSTHRLNNHIKVKHEFVPDSEQFYCHLCEKKFKIREYLDMHIRNQHSDGSLTQRLKNPCSICGKVLSSQTSLKNHEDKHILDAQLNPVKPFTCDLCGVSFRLKSYIFNHMHNVHIRRRYPCTFCSRGFYKKYELVDHLRLHTDEKPFACNYEGCSKRFTRKKNLQIHQRIHFNIRPYPCHLCDKSFIHFIDRKRHLMKHTGEKPHQCNVCQKGFSRKSEKDAHMKTHVRKI